MTSREQQIVVTFSCRNFVCPIFFMISDMGNGFSPEALQHAAEQFYMGDHSRTSHLHFGMELFITNSVIRQQKGQLILKNSVETSGAQVIVKLPVNSPV